MIDASRVFNDGTNSINYDIAVNAGVADGITEDIKVSVGSIGVFNYVVDDIIDDINVIADALNATKKVRS